MTELLRHGVTLTSDAPEDSPVVVASCRYVPKIPFESFGSPRCFDELERVGFKIWFDSKEASWSDIYAYCDDHGEFREIHQKMYKGKQPDFTLPRSGLKLVHEAVYQEENAYQNLSGFATAHRMLEGRYGFRFGLFETDVKYIQVRYVNNHEGDAVSVHQWVYM